ncbi:ABC transporter ATP-binding protein [Nocardioides insulae]|uniref:ABC transporter ATP-binding protein n=1 Tax=Nocardioides insulae TaxID=394734 RepID=UPI0003FB1252|nr:ATP-binding cassette domain-containing protein [Nocardioides insulae]
MLRVDAISKRYGDKPALDQVSFTVRPGRMTGFVGGNGAGKTTTMRIILGVLGADSGTVTLDGTPLSPADRRRFGYMPEERGLYPKMGVTEHLVYLARLHGWSEPAATRHAEQLLEDLDLTRHATDAIETLSLGNQQRAQIAAALVHQPEVLILDEPFSGLDPIAVERVQRVLHAHAEGGLPVLFSSHQLDIVERLCDDLVIIAAGSIRAEGERETLRDRYAGDRWELVVEDASWVAGWLGERGELHEDDPGRVVVEAPEPVLRHLLSAASDRGAVQSWQRLRPHLAEIFKEVVA